MLRRSASTLLLCLGALALSSSGSHAQDDLDAEMFTLVDDEDSLVGLDEFDSGPSSGPFSNKPGWPNLNPPVDDTPAPAPVPSPTTAAPAPGTAQQTVTGGAGAGTTAVSPTPAPTPALTPSMAPSPAAQQNANPSPSSSPSPASTTLAPAPAPASKPIVMPTPEPTKTTGQGGDLSDRSQCSKDSILVSVEGKGSYCVSATKPICSGSNSKGKCPGKQSGLEQGSHCGLVKSGVFGCLPGAGPVRCDVEED